jgi:peptide/nickel transport system substrate-binding protein
MYANAAVDKLLESASITTDEKSRIEKYAQFEQEIEKDMPAVFLYSPDFIYVVSKNLAGLSIDHIVSSSDRFSNCYLWYTETDNVWKIFSK